MNDLIQRLNNISDTYDDFISGVINYAKKDSEHVRILNEYIGSRTDLTTSDVIAFIIGQPDFHNYSATAVQNVG